MKTQAYPLKVINVVGINDKNEIIVKKNNGSIDTFDLVIPGNNTFIQEMKSKELEVDNLVLGGESVNIKFDLPQNSIFFNSISIAESNKKSLYQLSTLLTQTNIPVINHPKNVLLTARDNTAIYLSGIAGVTVPKCLKVLPKSIDDIINFITEKCIVFPFLVRPVIEHGGKTLIKINFIDEIDKLQGFALDGINEYYITEFCDFKSLDGFYRKMRFLIIGEEVIPRHLIVSSSWQIHNKKNLGECIQMTLNEEIGFLKQIDLALKEKFLQIKYKLGLDYFGIDCSVDSHNNITIFEVNSHSMEGVKTNEPSDKDNISLIYSSLLKLIKEVHFQSKNLSS